MLKRNKETKSRVEGETAVVSKDADALPPSHHGWITAGRACPSPNPHLTPPDLGPLALHDTAAILFCTKKGKRKT